MIVLLFWTQFRFGSFYENFNILEFVAIMLSHLATMLVLYQLIHKNELIKQSSYSILIFAFLSGVLPQAFFRLDIMIANFFVISGVLLTLDFRTTNKKKGKILEASLCMGIASLAYFWSIGFIILVFIGIGFFVSKDYRNWIIPIIGLISVYLFANTFTLLFYDTFFGINEYVDSISFLFEKVINNQQLASLGIILFFCVIFLSILGVKFQKYSAKIKPILNLFILLLVIAGLIIVISPSKDTSELYFIVIPLALIGTAYFDMRSYKWIKEISMWLCILLPFLVSFL